MKYKTCLCVITSIIISSTLYADNSYKGRGEAVIVNNNLPDAKKAALSDAFKNAVQRAVGVYVKSQTKVENFELSRDRIIAEAQGYIRDYRIIKEENEDGIYSVEIEADVYGDKIETAFSQRISKYIEKNIIGPAGINLMINGTPGNIQGLYINFHMPINDPTIEMDSIILGLPGEGWVKPVITSMGTINLMHYGEGNDTAGAKKLIDDLIIILEKRKAEVKLKNPANDKVEVRELVFNKFNSVFVSDASAGIPRGQMIKFKDYGDDNIRKIIKYLKSMK